MKYVTRTLLFMLLVVSILLFSFLGVEWSYMNLLCGYSAAVDVSFAEEESFDAFLQWMKENNVAVKRIDKKQDGTTEIYTSAADLDGKSWIEAVVSIFHPIKIYSLSKPENIGFYSRYYISLVSTDQINSMAEQLREEGVRCEFVSFTSAFTGLLSASWISRTRIVLFVVLFISLILVTIFSVISRRVRVLPNIVMSILCIVSISLVVPTIQNAFIEIRNLSMYKDKIDVFRINMNYIGQDESLEKEIEIQHVAEKAYAKLTKDNNGFFMDADAIHMNDMMKYSAEQNGLIGINGEETHITVSPNYFIHNPIQTSDGEPVESKINFDENTINLLVPGKYIKHSIQASYTEKDVLDAVYITKESNNAMVILYDAGKYTNDLDELMAYDESVTDWYTVELPEKYSVGEFRADLGLSGGALISPEVNPMPTWAPIEEWCYAGFIGKIQSDSTDVNIEFVNGVPQPIGLPAGNHFEKEILQVNPLENSDGWYVMEALSNNDLYTAAQLEELKESGKSLSDEEMFSLYWEFYFLKEGNDTYYYLTLAQKEFSFEEAKRIAQSVEMVD